MSEPPYGWEGDVIDRKHSNVKPKNTATDQLVEGLETYAEMLETVQRAIKVIQDLQDKLVAVESLSETRRVMLVDSYENVTVLCKERDELKQKIMDIEAEYQYEKGGHSHMQGLVTKANNRYDKLQIEKDRYQSLFEEEKESNLNNVMGYTQQVKDLKDEIAGLRHELKYRTPRGETWNDR